MQGICNDCFGSKKHNTTYRREKISKHAQDKNK